ncbi:atpase [Anaeramoeba ignava]|uniref:Atpase n=1 Tax=Anaeramoeba ignava TaxID=1746090 RepID=A0A9Q0LLH3_ANAIG|nr:atpase [Anaeramoeba ignava]|eukprot:Anaeramoba_ignava/a608225_283.p1 GENE.a608225_283~~a608225_283.p1  ORF type:complete len:1169 (-),score=337.64 a608225_283:102-3608(-)
MELIKQFSNESYLLKYLPISELIIEKVNFDKEKAFSGDLEYHLFVKLQLNLAMLHFYYSNKLFNELIKPQDQTKDFEEAQKLLNVIDKFNLLLGEIKQKKVELMETKPILVQSAEKMDLSQKEALLIEFLFIAQLGNEISMMIAQKMATRDKAKQDETVTYYYYYDPYTNFFNYYSRLSSQNELILSKYCRMTTEEYIHFFERSRPHIKSLIFIRTNYLNQSALELQEEFIDAFSGAKLSSEQILKLEQTSLIDIFQTESDQAHQAHAHSEETDRLKKIESLQPHDEDDLYDFISAQIQEEKRKQEEMEKQNGEEQSVEKIKPTIVDEAKKDLQDMVEKNKMFEEKMKEKKMNGNDPKMQNQDLHKHFAQMMKMGHEAQDLAEEYNGGIEGIDMDAEDQDEAFGIGDIRERKEDDEKEMEDDDSTETKLVAYENNMDYLKDFFMWATAKFQLQTELSYRKVYTENMYNDTMLRKFRIEEKKSRLTFEKRLKMTLEEKKFMPRMERLAKVRKLSEFEKRTVLFLIGSEIFEHMGYYKEYIEDGDHERRYKENPKYYIERAEKIRKGLIKQGIRIGKILTCFCETLDDQIQKRKCFYKNSKLVSEGIIRTFGVRQSCDTNLLFLMVNQKILDFIVGLDNEMEEVVEGSHMYTSRVKLKNVILPEQQKKLIVDTVSNFSNFQKYRKRLRLDKGMSDTHAGITMLFFGPSGTGKTMMANALGNELNKKIILVNFPKLGKFTQDETIRLLFKEAKIHQSILFFDECESLFETREKGQYDVNLLLTEIDRHDGIIILATNRPFDLDEGMQRRVTLSIEFKRPDAHTREDIWKTHISRSLRLADDVNIPELARKYELTGGFIKNSILTSLSLAVSRYNGDLENLVVTHDDFEQGAKQQLRGFLAMRQAKHHIVPKRGIDFLILPDSTLEDIKEIINSEKARKILFNWGFDDKMGYSNAATVLFSGPPGTGKTLAAEAIALETGKSMKVVNAAQLLSKYVGETPKQIDTLFTEAAQNDHLLVFDEAEGLFSHRVSDTTTSTDRYANIDTSLLLYHMERFKGIVILCTNSPDLIDSAFLRRMNYSIDFPMPEETLRLKLWRFFIPDSITIQKEADLSLIASRYPLSPAAIRNAVLLALSRMILRDKENHLLTAQDLETAALSEWRKNKDSETKLTHF